MGFEKAKGIAVDVASATVEASAEVSLDNLPILATALDCRELLMFSQIAL